MATKKKKSTIISRLRERRGESLVETLGSLMVICMAMVMLPGAIIAAARTNASAQAQSSVMDAESGEYGEVPEDVNVVISSVDASGSKTEIDTVSDATLFWYGSEANGVYRYGK